MVVVVVVVVASLTALPPDEREDGICVEREQLLDLCSADEVPVRC